MAEQRPLVLVFEDLHWADDELLDFVDHLVDWASGVPILIVCTARPELLDRRPGWGGGKLNATTLSLSPLTEADTSRLLSSLLERPLLAAEAQQELLARAGGNPLYAEQYAQLLLEGSAAEDLPVPESVQGIIAARLDRLAPGEKALLQDAAVLGKVFWLGGLVDGRSREEAGDALHALERKGFVQRARSSSVADESEYTFLHLLVRDVAYGQIPRAERADKHRRAAEWLASLAGDRAEDHAEMLAHHYHEALMLSEAAGLDTTALREPARKAFAQAAERAYGLNAYLTAIELGNEALALTPEDAPERPPLQLLVAYATWPIGRDDPGLIESARDGFLAQGDEGRAAEAAGLLSRTLFQRGDTEASRRAGAHAVELARGAPASSATGRALAQQARALEIMDREFEAALPLAREALEIANQLGDVSLASHALNTIGLARIDLGDAGGIADIEHAVTIAEEGGHPSATGPALNNLASCLSIVGRLADADATLARTRTFVERHGHTAGLVWNDGEQVEVAGLLGDLDRVFEWAERYFSHPEAEDLYQARGIWAARGRSFLARGQVEQAVADAERALARLRETGHDSQVTGQVLSAASLCLRAATRVEEADALLGETLSQLPKIVEHGTWDLPLHLVELDRAEEYLRPSENLVGHLWLEAGRATASGDLIGGSEIYGRIGARFPEAWAALLAAERGDTSRLEAALAYFEEQQATPYIERCRSLMQASA
jgi:tetratricopeptide (TPR) repeat protein